MLPKAPPGTVGIDAPPTMVASMTAFGRAAFESLDWEIKSVNHRYLELVFRLPEPLRDLERELRERTAASLARGKVEAFLRVAEQAAPAPRLNAETLRNLLRTVDQVRDLTDAAPPDPLNIMRWPGVLADDVADLAGLKAAAMAGFDAALADLVSHRRDEGAKLKTVIEEKLAAVGDLAATVRDLAATQSESARQRIQQRLDRLSVRVDSDRLAQEVALLAQKADVAEELDRLDIHVAEARKSLAEGEPCGRRLDFLMQELGREANTLAAKAVLPQASRLAVDLKVLVEQMREQVQNIE